MPARLLVGDLARLQQLDEGWSTEPKEVGCFLRADSLRKWGDADRVAGFHLVHHDRENAIDLIGKRDGLAVGTDQLRR